MNRACFGAVALVLVITFLLLSQVHQAYIPISLQLSGSLSAIGLNVVSVPLPIASMERFKKQQEKNASWIQETLCYPNSPIHSVQDKFLNGLSDGHLGIGRLRDTQTNSAAFQASYRDILTLSVRRIDVWGTTLDSPCADGEWAGSGTAFAWTTIRSVDKRAITVWITADHIPFLQDYQPTIKRVTHLRIDGQIDVIPLARHPQYRIAVLLASELTYEFPLDWARFGDNKDGQLFADDSWHVGDSVYVPFYTLTLQCLPDSYEDLYRRCIRELMIVDKGVIASAVPLDGQLGGEITITSNLVPGSSGAPYMLFSPDKDEGINVQDFKLLAVENAGLPSGIAVGQRFSIKDAKLIREALARLDTWPMVGAK